MNATSAMSRVALALLLSACSGPLGQGERGRRPVRRAPHAVAVGHSAPNVERPNPVAEQHVPIALMDCDRRRNAEDCLASISCPWLSADYAWAAELLAAGPARGRWTASMERLTVSVEAADAMGLTNVLASESVASAEARLANWSRQSLWVCGCGGADACAVAGRRGYAQIMCEDAECAVTMLTGESAIATCAAEREAVGQERSDDDPGCVFPSAMPGLARCGGQSAYVDGRTIVLTRSPECGILGSIAWRGAGGDRVADLQGQSLLVVLRGLLARMR